LQAVRHMQKTPWVQYYTNIKTEGLPNVHPLAYDMIIKKEDTGKVSKGQPVCEYKLNKEFWESVPKPVSVILDEVHNILSSRSSMSHVNKIATKWLSLLRKMVGQNDTGYGDLICITQLSGSADVILRSMAHQVVYFINFYKKHCRTCEWTWKENSDMPEQRTTCKRCGGHDLYKSDFRTLMMKFSSVPNFDMWKMYKDPRIPYCTRWITGSEKYFKNYDTLQIDDLFSDY
jgi:hypothetical protein